MAIKGYKLPRAYQLGSAGCACFLEPPGHPRYFVRSVYTQYGNSPRAQSPQYMLTEIDTAFFRLEGVDKHYGRAAFPKLPLEHERTRAWIATLYAYFNHCYHRDNEVPGSGKDLEIVRAGDIAVKNPFGEIIINPDEYEAWVKANAHRHKAVLFIQKYYPEYQPELDLILNPPIWGKGGLGDWWERLDHKPTPENCPGELGKVHPVNGNWCQMCGWVGEQK